MFSDDYKEVMHISQEYHRGDVVPFSKHLIRRCMMSVCLIVGNVDLDHWIKVVSAGFLHCEVTIFPFHILFLEAND